MATAPLNTSDLPGIRVDLAGLVTQAVQTPELAPLLNESGLTVDEIVRKIQPRLNEILSVAADERAVLEKSAVELEAAKQQQAQAIGRIPPSKSGRALWLGSFGWGLLVSFLALVLSRVAYAYFKPNAGISERTLDLLLAFAAMVCVIWTFLAAAYRRGKSAREYADSQRAIIANSGVADLEQQTTKLRAQFNDALYKRGILQEVTGILSNATAPSYAAQLPEDASGKGLSEVFTSAHEIKTQARRDLDELLKLPGGSIGLAGSRGVGKTTLMTLVANRPVMDGKKPCSIMCPAPVEYSGRDYLVTLFVLLCNRVVEDQPPSPGLGRAAPFADEQNRRPIPVWGNAVSSFLYSSSRYLLFVGTLLVSWACFTALVAMSAARHQAATQTAVATPAPASTAAHAAPSNPAKTTTPNPAGPGAVAEAKGAKGESEKPAQSESAWQRLLMAPGDLLKAFGLQPVTILKWGLLLVALAWLAAFCRPWLIANLDPRAQIEHRPGMGGSFGIARVVRMYDRPAEASSGLYYVARRHLESLRFQQSYTSGWSGSLKLPFGVEGGINDAQTLARNQRSLPELVQDFREFLQLLAAKYGRVIIGIDELDKLESDAKAHLFLNEIKAIFGISKVFYLVSVSENAVSAFERRGLPFRDVFDSSFDTIVHVDYLKLNESKQLLKRRTTRIPEPFLCLSHCLSGGLPRDLIRTCRDMLEIAVQENLRDLVPLAAKVVTQEVHAKARAMTIAAAKLSAGPPQARFLSDLTELLAGEANAPALLLRAGQLLSAADATRAQTAAMPLSPKGALSDDAKNLKALAELQTEFGLYLAYVATVLEVVGSAQPGQNWQALENDTPVAVNIFDGLASNRQVLAISATVGRDRLVQLRSAQGLAPVNVTPPPAPEVATKTAADNPAK